MRGGVRILLVEDRDDVRESIAAVLADWGYGRLTQVADFPSAMTTLANQKVDLVISDIMLPGGSGRDIAAEARRRGAKVLLMTGFPDAMKQCAETRTDCLMKPFRSEELIGRLDARLDGHGDIGALSGNTLQ